MSTSDKHTNWLRTGLAAVGLSAAALFTAGITATPAYADASGCDTEHDTCIYVTGSAGGNVTVYASAYTEDFRGTMTLTAPGGFKATSPDQVFTGNGTSEWSYTFTGAWTGEYCVEGYSDDNQNEGMACEQVS